MPHSTFPNNPQLMLPKHYVHRIVPVASHPNRTQRPTRLRINNIHNLAPSAENQPIGTRPDTIVEVLQRATEQTAISQNRQFLSSSNDEFERSEPTPRESWQSYTARRITTEL